MQHKKTDSPDLSKQGTDNTQFKNAASAQSGNSLTVSLAVITITGALILTLYPDLMTKTWKTGVHDMEMTIRGFSFFVA
jgi:hypothetical protein